MQHLTLVVMDPGLRRDGAECVEAQASYILITA
jgi:hypothetical protein